MQRLQVRKFTLLLLLLITTPIFAAHPAGHWGYPGDIRSHLQQHHGISTAGMSYQQMLTTHDQLHEGNFGVRSGGVQYYRTQPTTVRPLRFFRWFR